MRTAVKFSGVSEKEEEGDLPRLAEWIAADQWHKGGPAGWWTSPESVVTARLDDDIGPVIYLRINRDGERVRLNLQFAPVSAVSKLRVARVLKNAIPRIINVMRHQSIGVVFSSENPPLIGFGLKFGFKSIGNNDFLYSFRDDLNEKH